METLKTPKVQWRAYLALYLEGKALDMHNSDISDCALTDFDVCMSIICTFLVETPELALQNGGH